ncbi:MAG TPA: hypothetical protein VMW75_15380 [Thermoanaerobaculia bacterium]|nr:hypothetical protein [Thermoanaerobaculia bacterium]
MRTPRLTPGTGLAFALLAVAGCHSYHVDVTVENRTGGLIRLLEVDYPSASFGADNLASGATMRYRIQLQGNGALKVQYTAPDNHQFQIQGPAVTQGQEGKLAIVLEPDGKADFNADLKQ